MSMFVILLLGVIGAITVFYCSRNSFSTMKNFLIGFLTMLISCLIIFSIVYFYRLNTGDDIKNVDLIIGTLCLLGACVICGVKCATTINDFK